MLNPIMKSFVAAIGKTILTPLIIVYALFAFIYDERMGAKLNELLTPSAKLLLPIVLCVGLVAMPLLYLNRRTRFYAGIGFGLSGIYLLTIAWLQCLWWSQNFLNNFFFNAANFILPHPHVLKLTRYPTATANSTTVLGSVYRKSLHDAESDTLEPVTAIEVARAV